MDFCNTCSTKVGKRYDRENCKTVTRPYGMDRMIGFHCSVDFTDILDTASEGEWDAYLTSGDIIVTPSGGKFAFGDGTTDTLTDGCGVKFTDITERPWTFTSFSTAEDFSDETWWRDFHLEFGNYTWGWLTCSGNGRIAFEDSVVQAIKASLAEVSVVAVPVSSPGYKMSIDKIPVFEAVNGDGKAGQWSTGGTFLHNTVLQTVEIPGLSALIKSLG